ncbi:hypothetical protein PV350_04665 [Streptomyces sp. PA03-6a]|nr:hypothetical protein [Streptomyces sp. PA03-6a]
MQTWLAGQRVTAGGLNKMLPLVAYKPATTSRSSNTTATADPDLAISIPADALVSYIIEAFLSVTGAAISTGDIKVGLSYSGTLSMATWMGTGTTTASITNTNFFGKSVDGTTQSYGVNGGQFSQVVLNGQITPTTAGTLSVVWAQNTSNATATNVRLSSWIKLTRIDP